MVLLLKLPLLDLTSIWYPETLYHIMYIGVIYSARSLGHFPNIMAQIF